MEPIVTLDLTKEAQWMDNIGKWWSDPDNGAARASLIGAGIGGAGLGLRRALSKRDKDHKKRGILSQALLGAVLGGGGGFALSQALKDPNQAEEPPREGFSKVTGPVGDAVNTAADAVDTVAGGALNLIGDAASKRPVTELAGATIAGLGANSYMKRFGFDKQLIRHISKLERSASGPTLKSLAKLNNLTANYNKAVAPLRGAERSAYTSSRLGRLANLPDGSPGKRFAEWYAQRHAVGLDAGANATQRAAYSNSGPLKRLIKPKPYNLPRSILTQNGKAVTPNAGAAGIPSAVLQREVGAISPTAYQAAQRANWASGKYARRAGSGVSAAVVYKLVGILRKAFQTKAVGSDPGYNNEIMDFEVN